MLEVLHNPTKSWLLSQHYCAWTFNECGKLAVGYWLLAALKILSVRLWAWSRVDSSADALLTVAQASDGVYFGGV